MNELIKMNEMKTRIKEAAREYVKNEQGINSEICHAVGNINKLEKLISHFEEVFIAGAEFMQDEANENMVSYQKSLAKTYTKTILDSEVEIKKLKAQNEIIREALDTIRNKPTPYYVIYTYQERDYYLTVAEKALKKIGEV